MQLSSQDGLSRRKILGRPASGAIALCNSLPPKLCDD